MLLKKIVALGLFFFIPIIALATPYGINFSYLLIAKDPSNLHGYRASFLYEPDTWHWKYLQVFFDLSYGHWWLNGNGPYRTINIYAIAPVLRLYLINNTKVSPFVDISIGPSYMTKTRIECRNLGEHFSFQDQLSIGAAFGVEKKLAFSLSILHYSNGSLSSMNAGITVPLLINMSYRL